jgi:hypothetical protein
MGSAPGVTAGTAREIVLVQGSADQPGYVRGLNVEQWSMQGFMAESLSMDFGQIIADLRLEDDALLGTVRNESRYTLADSAILLGKRFVRLGDLAPDSEVEFKLNLSDMGTPNFGPSISWALFEGQLNSPAPNVSTRQAEVRRSIVESVFERTPAPIKVGFTSASSGNTPGLSNVPVLIGWMDQAPPDVSVAGDAPAQQTTAIVVQPLAYRLPEEGRIDLPVGLIPGALAKSPLEGGSCGEPGSTAVYLFRGDAIFEFVVPAELRDSQVENLKLSLANDAGFFTAPEVALYNWQLDQWVVLDGFQQGVNFIPHARDLVRADGLIQLRLTAAENAQACYYVALGLEGQR